MELSQLFAAQHLPGQLHGCHKTPPNHIQDAWYFALFHCSDLVRRCTEKAVNDVGRLFRRNRCNILQLDVCVVHNVDVWNCSLCTTRNTWPVALVRHGVPDSTCLVPSALHKLESPPRVHTVCDRSRCHEPHSRNPAKIPAVVRSEFTFWELSRDQRQVLQARVWPTSGVALFFCECAGVCTRLLRIGFWSGL